jgi:hypothetical protein
VDSVSIRVEPRWPASAIALTVTTLALASLACQSLSTPFATATPSQPPTPPHVPPIEGRTRSDPFPAAVTGTTANWEVQIEESVRGGQAWEMLRAANQFNDPAPEGFEYVVVYAHLTSRHTDGATHEVYATDLQLTGDRLQRYRKADGVPPAPVLDAEVRAGETAEGWTVFLVPRGEASLIVIVDVLSDEGTDDERYFALDAGARVVVDGALDAIEPNAVGEDLSEPALLNRTAIAPDWEITVLDVVRGAAAYEMALATNQFNDAPAEGMEYVAVKVRARNLNTRDEDVWLDGNSFMTLGSDGAMYDSPPVVDPEPALDARLYPGGEATGWIVVQAKIDDPTLLVFQPFTDFEKINRRYFSLTP